MTSSDRLFAGTTRFELKRRLGSGGMGVVYEAFDRQLDTPVAIKTLKSVDAQSIYRMKREFRALQGLEHPNLARLGELVEHDGHWFFTMELVRGIDFLRYVRATAPERDWEHVSPSEDTMQSMRVAASPFAPCDESRLRAAFGQLAAGLCALHDAGKVHRDIKPSNTLVTGDGRVVLLDFGLITEARKDHQSTELSAVGTAEYMSPEQGAAKPIGPAADWYSAGVMLYEALTSRLPFTGTPLQVLMDKQHRHAPRPSALVPTVSSDLEDLCMDLLRVDPQARPSGKEVLRRLGVSSGTAPLSRTTSAGSMTPPFVGRVRELRILEAAARRDTRGPTVVHLWGESGVGKSELVREFCTRLSRDAPDAAILSGRCYERESVPYRALDGVADSLCSYLRRLPEQDAAAMMPRRAGLLAKLFPVLLRVDPIARAPIAGAAATDPQEARARMFTAFRGLFEMMADRCPVVVVIDDFQWADADSFTLLSELLHPPDAPPLLLLTTARDRAAGDRLSAAMEAIGAPLAMEHLEIGRLPAAEALALVERLKPKLGPGVERDALFEAIVRESEGHPLFILELVRHGESGGTAGAALRLDEALWERIAHLPDDPRALLEALCIAGTPLAVEVAGATARLDRAATDRALSVLRVAYLARTTQAQTGSAEPYHDRVRAAVLTHLGDEVRRELHDRLANALEAAGAAERAPQVLVRHFEAAGKTQVAARHAVEAAHRARRALAFQQAADLYRDALRLGELDDEARRDLGINLADALANAGRCSEAADIYLEVAANAKDNQTRFECRRRAVDQLLVGGEIERGIEAVRTLLDDIGVPMPATPTRSLVSLLWNRLRLRLRGVEWTDTHERDVPGAVLTKLDVLQSVGRGLAMVDNVRGADFQARALRLALRTGESTRIGWALGMESVYLASQGGASARRSQQRVARLQRLADETQIPLVQAWAIIAEGAGNYFASNFDLAAEQLERAAEAFRDRTTGTTYELNNSRLFRLFALRRAGRIADAAALHDPSVADAVRRGDRYMQTTMRRYGSFLWLARGRPGDAERGLAETTWVPPQDRFHIQHWFELEALSEIALYRGTAAAALDEYAERFAAMGKSLLRRIQVLRVVETSLCGRLLLSANAEARAPEPAQRARKLARKLAREDIGFAKVYARLLAAGAERQLGRPAAAVTELRAALEATDRPPMRLARACAQLRLAELVGGSEADELRVAADLYARSEGVADLSRFAEVLAPGFG